MREVSAATQGYVFGSCDLPHRKAGAASSGVETFSARVQGFSPTGGSDGIKKVHVRMWKHYKESPFAGKAKIADFIK